MTRLLPIFLSIPALMAQSAPGVLVDAGGYRVHLDCAGSGEPTVVIAGGFSFDWVLVQPEIAKMTRVCTYDASGNAWSDPAPLPITCRGRVMELHAVLHKGEVDGPYVLAGLSTGALFARMYARNYSSEVAGLVLIDHAFLPPKTPPATPVASGPDSPPSVIYAAPVVFGVEDEPGFDKLPEETRKLHHWAMSRNPALPTAELAEDCAAALGDARPGNLPLVVVSTANDTPGYAKLQTELLGLSRRSTQFIAAESFHSIEISQPEVVVRAIRQAVEETRK